MGVTGVLGEQPAPDQTETRAAQLSVVVPVFNERDGLRELYAEIESACDSIGLAWELIFVDDGSTDGTAELLQELAAERSQIRMVRLRRNFGKSAALAAGFEQTRGQTVVTLDGDGQDDPAEIPALVARATSSSRDGSASAKIRGCDAGRRACSTGSPHACRG
jgi:glycosyltransferase involved in cell wall biosynthesis